MTTTTTAAAATGVHCGERKLAVVLVVVLVPAALMQSACLLGTRLDCCVLRHTVRCVPETGSVGSAVVTTLHPRAHACAAVCQPTAWVLHE
jgi:hypothetical protein